VEPGTFPNLKHTPFVVFFDFAIKVIGYLTNGFAIISASTPVYTSG
jgi:hypothetical protein